MEKKDSVRIDDLAHDDDELSSEELLAVAGGRCKQMPTEGGGICAVDTVCTT